MVTMAQSAANWRNMHTHMHSLTHLHQTQLQPRGAKRQLSYLKEGGVFFLPLSIPGKGNQPVNACAMQFLGSERKLHKTLLALLTHRGRVGSLSLVTSTLSWQQSSKLSTLLSAPSMLQSGNVHLSEFADFRESKKNQEKKRKKPQFLPWTEFSDECVCILLLCLKAVIFFLKLLIND